MTEKTCTKCDLAKHLSEYSVRRASPDGYTFRCKQCIKEDSAEWYKNNKEAIDKRQSLYLEKNRDAVNDRKRVAAEKNREHINAGNRAYRNRNKVEINASNRAAYKKDNSVQLERGRVWREANKDLANERQRALYKENREERIIAARGYRERNKDSLQESRKRWRRNNEEIHRAGAARRRARKLGASVGVFTSADVLAKWGIDCHICMELVDLDAPKNCRGEGWERGLHLEHVIALANGGSHTLDNVKPSHALCNLRKNAS